jgi:hypothetical protein
MDEKIDKELRELGAWWRASQPPSPSIDTAMLAPRIRDRKLGALAAAAAAAAAVVVVAFIAGGISGPVWLPGGGAKTSAVPSMADCPVTKPDRSFVPPSPYPHDPTPGDQKVWYGTERLWTMLNKDGETWGRMINAPRTISVKLFWWSTAWSPDAEPQPDISVVGKQLDGPGAFTVGSPATNATADFGTAMLVGVDVPTPGCWQITGTYRGTSLSYVVRAVDN